MSCVRCPGPLGSGSPVCTRCLWCYLCGVLGLLAPVHRCACSLCAPRMLPIPLPHPRLFLCMLSVTALLVFLPPSSCPRGAPGVCIRVSVCVSPLFRPPLLLFPLARVLLVLPPHLSLPLPPLAAIVSPPLWFFRSGLHVPMCPCAHPPPRLLLLPSCSFSSRFASSLLFVLPLLFLALVLVLLSVSLRRRLLLLVCCPGRSIHGPLRPWSSQSRRIASPFQFAAPGAPPDFLRYSLCCPGRSSPWHRVHPRMIQSGGSGRASFRPGCSNPGRLFVLFFPLPRTLLPMAPGSPLDDPFRGLLPCFVPSRMLHSEAPLNRILSFALNASVCSTGFSPGRSSPGARAVLHSAPDAPLLGVFLSYSLRCLGRSSPWRRVHPRTIESGGLCRASFRPGCSLPGRLFIVFSPLPGTLQSVAPGSPPDDPVRGLLPCFMPPLMLQSGASFYRILSVAPDAPVRGTGFTPGRSSPGGSVVLHAAPGAPILAVFLLYSLRCPGTLQSGAPGSPPDDPVWGLAPCFIPPRPLQLGASFYRILSIASDAPVLGTGFTPGRSSLGAIGVLHAAPDAPIRGIFLSYSLRCPGRSSPSHRFHPRTIQSGR